MKKIPILLSLFITSFFTLFAVSCRPNPDIFIYVSKNRVELNLAIEEQKEETVMITNYSQLEDIRIGYVDDADKYIKFNRKYDNLTITAIEETSVAKLMITAQNAITPTIVSVNVKNEAPIIPEKYEFDINPKTIEITTKKPYYEFEIDVTVKDNEPEVLQKLKFETNWVFCEENSNFYPNVKIILKWKNNKIKLEIFDNNLTIKNYDYLNIDLWFENSKNKQTLGILFNRNDLLFQK